LNRYLPSTNLQQQQQAQQKLAALISGLSINLNIPKSDIDGSSQVMDAAASILAVKERNKMLVLMIIIESFMIICIVIMSFQFCALIKSRT